MLHSQIYQRSLPLLAAALSEQHNIRVEIGGSEAFTDGRTIHLPALPLDADEELVGVARGYIDHESAHVLFSDFDALTHANLTPLEKYFANTIEDVCIEKLMAKRYPGSATNLRDTARHVFLREIDKVTGKAAKSPEKAILNAVLLEMRSETLPELRTAATKLWLDIDRAYPGLSDRLRSVLSCAKSECTETSESIEYARRLIEVLREYATEQQDSENYDNNTKGEKVKPLSDLISTTEDQLPTGIDSKLEEELNKQYDSSYSAVCSLGEVQPKFETMSNEMLLQTQRLMADLRPRLQGVLQARTFEGRVRAYQGCLNPRLLHSVPLGNGKVFTRSTPKSLTSTAIHVLLDRSSSTAGIIDQASASAYALVHAVQAIRGVRAALTTFPVETGTIEEGIATLLDYGSRAENYKAVTSYGCTPLAEAIWHVTPKLMRRQEHRKILVVFTDGVPDSFEKARRALNEVESLGVEVYAVSYGCALAKDLFKHCVVIEKIEQLPVAFFEMITNVLQKAA